jgi:hypothetical protein
MSNFLPYLACQAWLKTAPEIPYPPSFALPPLFLSGLGADEGSGGAGHGYALGGCWQHTVFDCAFIKHGTDFGLWTAYIHMTSDKGVHALIEIFCVQCVVPHAKCMCMCS